MTQLFTIVIVFEQVSKLQHALKEVKREARKERQALVSEVQCFCDTTACYYHAIFRHGCGCLKVLLWRNLQSFLNVDSMLIIMKQQSNQIHCLELHAQENVIRILHTIKLYPVNTRKGCSRFCWNYAQLDAVIDILSTRLD